MATTKQKIIWTAQPGPQTEFLHAKEFEILFGGSKGGGKSESLVMCMLSPPYIKNKNYHGLILRRTYPRLLEIKDRCDYYYKKIDPGCKYSSDEKRYYFSSGAKIKLGHCEHEDDKWNYWGQEFQILCTVTGTPVLMADGKYKPVHELKPGDLVHTLSGARQVTNVRKPRLAPCVMVRTRFGHQIQTADHALLCSPSNWLAYRDLCLSESSLSTQSQGHCMSQLLACDRRGIHEQTAVSNNLGQGHVSVQPPVAAGPFSSSWDCVSPGVGDRISSLETSEKHQSYLPPAVVYYPVMLHEPSLQLPIDSLYGDERVHRETLVQGSQSYCRTYRHSCGEQIHLDTTSYQDEVPLLYDVEQYQNFRHQDFSQLDSLVEFAKLYHPYTMETFVSQDPLVSSFCSITPCGSYPVVDITIEDQNHYITWGGFVNRNCIDQIEEFTESQYEIIRMSARSTVEGLSPIIRCSANPGALWVKKRWIDVAPPNEVYEYEMPTADGNSIKLTRRFIPARVYDNKILLQRDPQYLAVLQSIGNEKLRKQMLEGDWEASDDAAFSEFDRQKHVKRHVELFDGTGLPPKNWTVFASMDWGYSTPFAIHWHCITPYDKIITFKEWYGVKLDPIKMEVVPNVGLHMLDRDVAKGFCQRSEGIDVSFLIADRSIWNRTGVESGTIGQTFELVCAEKGIPVIRSDNSPGTRLARKMQTHARLADAQDGSPWWLISDSCTHLIRTLPFLPLDHTDQELVETHNVEDHCFDSVSISFLRFPLELETIMSKRSSRFDGYGRVSGAYNQSKTLVSTYH